MKFLFVVAFVAATITAVSALPVDEVPAAVENVAVVNMRKATSTKHPKTTSTSKSQPTSTKPSGKVFSGDGTYFTPDTGACGKRNKSSDLIAALNKPQYGNVDKKSPECGKCALVKGPLGQVKVQIVDACPECKFGSLDLSPTAFEKIAKKKDGRVKITWTYTSC
ncbi:hypothetical protein FBU59_000315 [Linderina macrospora]|uniref:Uncharacterized protein n=1 Tax=Linderina macrospora TaxID=4868 RepID=A0ACC1JHH4_9FUNG|nr:hypothetical protein FBU59_000315 [Linderina macrospora]